MVIKLSKDAPPKTHPIVSFKFLKEQQRFSGNPNFLHLPLDLFAAERLPVLGVRRGLQVINVHYGGDLKQVDNHMAQCHLTALNPGWPVRAVLIANVWLEVGTHPKFELYRHMETEGSKANFSTFEQRPVALNRGRSLSP